jgi:hypothetical protein
MKGGEKGTPVAEKMITKNKRLRSFSLVQRNFLRETE